MNRCGGVYYQGTACGDCEQCNANNEEMKRMVPKFREVRVALNDEQFRALVRGGQVTVKEEGRPDVCLILNDIGYDRMVSHIDSAAIKGVKSFQEESVGG